MPLAHFLYALPQISKSPRKSTLRPKRKRALRIHRCDFSLFQNSHAALFQNPSPFPAPMMFPRTTQKPETSPADFQRSSFSVVPPLLPTLYPLTPHPPVDTHRTLNPKKPPIPRHSYQTTVPSISPRQGQSRPPHHKNPRQFAALKPPFRSSLSAQMENRNQNRFRSDTIFSRCAQLTTNQRLTTVHGRHPSAPYDPSSSLCPTSRLLPTAYCPLPPARCPLHFPPPGFLAS